MDIPLPFVRAAILVIRSLSQFALADKTKRADSRSRYRQSPGAARPQHAQGETTPILVGLDTRLNLKHRIAHRCEPVGFVSLREQFGLDDARPVSEGKKLHRFTRNLVVGALLDDEPAGGDGLANEFAEAIHGTVAVPGHGIEQFEGMTTDGETEQVRFRFQAFATSRLIERDSGQLFQAGRRDEPALVRFYAGAKGLEEKLRLPELARAGFSEFIECADANHRFEFLARRRNAMEEVGY